MCLYAGMKFSAGYLICRVIRSYISGLALKIHLINAFCENTELQRNTETLVSYS